MNIKPSDDYDNLEFWLNFSSNENVDNYFQGNGTDGLSWNTAYHLSGLNVTNTDPFYFGAIYLRNISRYLVISNCEIHNFLVGIVYEKSTHLNVSGCLFINGFSGVNLNEANDVSITKTNFTEFSIGIDFQGKSNLQMDDSNLLCGYPIYYLENLNHFNFDIYLDARQILLKNCSYFTLDLPKLVNTVPYYQFLECQHFDILNSLSFQDDVEFGYLNIVAIACNNVSVSEVNAYEESLFELHVKALKCSNLKIEDSFIKSMNVQLEECSSTVFNDIKVINGELDFWVKNSTNTAVTSSRFEDCSRCDIDFISSDNIKFWYNKIISCGSGVLDRKIEFSNCKNIEIFASDFEKGSSPSCYIVQSNNVTIQECKFMNEDFFGIYFEWSSNAEIMGCTIQNFTDSGIYLSRSTNGTIYNNYFANNTKHIDIQSSQSIDLNKSTQGNYWDDYLSKYPDAEMTGNGSYWDTPYAIKLSFSDYYPYTMPWGEIPKDFTRNSKDLKIAGYPLLWVPFWSLIGILYARKKVFPKNQP